MPRPGPAPQDAEQPLRELLCRMLRSFYGKDWVSGTGGGICATTPGGALLVAPTGVHKELVEPDDLFLLDRDAGSVLLAPRQAGLSPSECSPIFAAIVRERDAGSVVHSHALAAVLAADVAATDVLVIENLEMLKGVRGSAYPSAHHIPVIANTPRERDLTGDVEAALKDDRFAGAYAILVRDHGANIWGEDVWEAKRHAEVYHFLFEATVRRRRI